MSHRRRMDDAEQRSQDRPRDPLRARVGKLFRTFDGGEYPTEIADQGTYFLTHALSPSGVEGREGDPATLGPESQGVTGVLVLGTVVPEIGAVLTAHQVGGRWVAHPAGKPDTPPKRSCLIFQNGCSLGGNTQPYPNPPHSVVPGGSAWMNGVKVKLWNDDGDTFESETSGMVIAYAVTNGGSGWDITQPPPEITVDPPPAGGTTATAKASYGGGVLIRPVTVTDGGSGYTHPVAEVKGGPKGKGAILTPQSKITAVTVSDGGSGYTDGDYNNGQFSSGGSFDYTVRGGVIQPRIVITDTPVVLLTAPSVIFHAGTGTGVKAKATMSVVSVQILADAALGSFYVDPKITFRDSAGDGKDAAATVTATPIVLGRIDPVEIGSGYYVDAPPNVTIDPDNGATALAGIQNQACFPGLETGLYHMRWGGGFWTTLSSEPGSFQFYDDGSQSFLVFPRAHSAIGAAFGLWNLPLTGAELEAVDPDGNVVLSATVGDDGTYNFPSLPDPPWPEVSEALTVKWKPGTIYAERFAPFEVTLGIATCATDFHTNIATIQFLSPAPGYAQADCNIPIKTTLSGNSAQFGGFALEYVATDSRGGFVGAWRGSGVAGYAGSPLGCDGKGVRVDYEYAPRNAYGFSQGHSTVGIRWWVRFEFHDPLPDDNFCPLADGNDPPNVYSGPTGGGLASMTCPPDGFSLTWTVAAGTPPGGRSDIYLGAGDTITIQE